MLMGAGSGVPQARRPKTVLRNWRPGMAITRYAKGKGTGPIIPSGTLDWVHFPVGGLRTAHRPLQGFCCVMDSLVREHEMGATFRIVAL